MGILIISSKMNSEVCDRLLNIAENELDQNKKKYSLIEVPGAFEIPAALSFTAKSEQSYEGYVILGCVIRSRTPHFEYICNAAVYGITKVTLKHNLAVGLGVITSENEQQALERSNGENGFNYAKKAVETCLQMIKLKNNLNVQ